MHSQTIEGVGSISGGEYDRIGIEGVGNSKGDIIVKELDIEGVFKSSGKIKADSIQCEGVAELSDDVRANKLIIEGVMKLSKNAKLEAEEIICDGCMYTKSEISTDRLYVDGCIKAQEIFGEEIIINSKSSVTSKINSLLKNINESFAIFGNAKKSSSKADLIEATTVTIHNTQVREINGANITIGENCEVDHVDCTGTLRVHHTAIVKKITGVTPKYTE
ncbi:hypothetical protein [Clostridium sp. Marseille-P299]|uniref:hypothetical protein n=1 Tax=Clostridium sp. Marseille-P299 TaxID=1805477 RepID=UPI00082C6F26|nr:hypothetical protein [Clostridium sp. Marseille-P299]